MRDTQKEIPKDFRRKSAFPAKSKQIRRMGISMSHRVLEQLFDLIESQGHTSVSGAISSCVMAAHKREFPAYRQQLMAQQQQDQSGEPVKKLTARQQLEHDTRQKCLAYAEALHAEVVIVGGVECARYYTYHMRDRFDNTIPLLSLTDSVVDSQYFPSRVKVESFQKSGSCNYDVTNVL